MMAYRYRDTQTGHFAKKSTWKRSHSHGGKRYKRERILKRKPTPPPNEYIVDTSYSRKKSRSGALKIHVMAPPGLSRDTILSQIEQWSLEVPLPQGWTIRAINWRDKEYNSTDLQTMLRNMFASGKLS